jgi:hypothetical protein
MYMDCGRHGGGSTDSNQQGSAGSSCGLHCRYNIYASRSSVSPNPRSQRIKLLTSHQIVQKVLTTTDLASQLLTMALILHELHILRYRDVSHEYSAPMEVPHLTHLTLAPGTRPISGIRVRALHLTSLHISFDDRFKTENQLVSYGTFFPELSQTLREYNINTERSARVEKIPLTLLMTLIAPIFERGLHLVKLTLLRLEPCDDEDSELEQSLFNGNDCIGLLVLEDVTYRLFQPGHYHKWSRPVRVGEGWKPFKAMVERSDEHRVVQGVVQGFPDAYYDSDE